MSEVIKIHPQQKWDFKYHPRRVCIPIGMACNVKCKYCLRLSGKVREPKGLTPMMKAFLAQLNPAEIEAVVINGGEPLLYVDRIKEVFSIVPRDIHKVVMTNGTLLTEDFVDYLNSIDGELHFSHEGTGAMELKGVDVLQDERIVKCLNKVRQMRVYNICTSINPDTLANYEYIRSKITDVDFWFSTFPMFAFAENEHLVEGFDFDVYARSLLELYDRYPHVMRNPSHHSMVGRRNLGFNVLPDGSVASISDLKIYGTVLQSKEELLQIVHEMGDDAFCLSQKCDLRESCTTAYQCATPFTCKAMAVHRAVINHMRNVQDAR